DRRFREIHPRAEARHLAENGANDGRLTSGAGHDSARDEREPATRRLRVRAAPGPWRQPVFVEERTEQRVVEGTLDPNGDDLARRIDAGRLEVHDLVSLRAPRELTPFTGALDEHGLNRTDAAVEVLAPQLLGHFEEPREPFALFFFGHVVAESERRRVRPRRVLEPKKPGKLDRSHEL